MKKILFFVLLIASSLSLNAQDILVRKSGEVENVKVLEVSPTEIKYKKSNNEEGPIFIEKRSNIYSIKYINGEVQTFYDNQEGLGSNSIYSNYGKDKKLSHEFDIFIQDGWGIGYQLRRELNPYVALNILGISYMSDFCNPKECGLLNIRALGFKLYTPAYQSFRIYAGLNLGYTYAYANYEFNNRWYASFKEHLFGLDFSTGIQIHKNIAIGYNLNFIKNSNCKGTSHWGNIMFLF
jgi:hypothetical protein